MTDPGTQGLRLHGIREIERSDGPVDAFVEDIRNIGYSVAPSGLSPSRLQDLRERIDAVYRRQVDEIGGEHVLQRIRDAKVGRCLIEYDDSFVALAAHPLLTEICRHLLGDYYILMSQNAIINDPVDEHYQVTWHRDLNYQHFVSSRPLAVSALYCIDDFSELTGGTNVLPASHKAEKFPSPEYVGRHQRTIEAPAGSIVVFDAMLFHRAGLNRSGRVRRAVNHIFTLPLIRQQISLPSVLKGKYRDDPRLARLLGYGIETAASVADWRAEKVRQAPSASAT